MGLRPAHIYNRLNRACLDSGAFFIHRNEIIQLYLEVKSAHAAWLKGCSPTRLASASQHFIDLLSEVFLVSRKSLSLSDRPRPHRQDGEGRLKSEVHGMCSPDGNIRIYLRTARQGRPTAFKTLFNTLIHEWVHHYDFEALGDTIHCAGFYRRVGAVYNCCLESENNAHERQGS
jgi:hypothetical protein